jgi:AcrR family transcriptional regulator
MKNNTEHAGTPLPNISETRSRLLDAAKDEFLDSGLQAAKIASICRRAGLANGTFYLHFRTIEDVYRELLVQATNELARRLAEISLFEVDARARDRIGVSVIFDFAEEREDLFRLMSDGRVSYSVAHKTLFDSFYDQRRSAIARGVASGEYRDGLDPTITAIADIGITTEVVSWWLEKQGERPKQFAMERLIDLRARMYFDD